MPSSTYYSSSGSSSSRPGGLYFHQAPWNGYTSEGDIVGGAVTYSQSTESTGGGRERPTGGTPETIREFVSELYQSLGRYQPQERGIGGVSGPIEVREEPSQSLEEEFFSRQSHSPRSRGPSLPSGAPS